MVALRAQFLNFRTFFKIGQLLLLKQMTANLSELHKFEVSCLSSKD